VRLCDLLAATDGLEARLNGAAGATLDVMSVQVTAIVHDTADIVPGALYCCIPGSRIDGHDLAPAAVAAGATALLVDHPVDLPDPVPQVVVPDVRAAMGPLASAFWGHPSRRLTVVGVTGTAGKTTVTHLLQSVLSLAGRPCGLVGTLSGTHTTPEAPELQARLAADRDAGRSAVAMEVSSHGLDMHRVDGTRFEVAVFTNLSRDHLDFHDSMEAYFDAKARLFTRAFTDRAVICSDDRWGQKLLERASAGGLELHPYSLADAQDLEFGPDGASFTWEGTRIHIGLTGRFNVANAVAAATAARAVGVGAEAIAQGLHRAGAVPGRFERIDAGQPFTVLVDYSHKPDALENALRAARDLANGQVLGRPEPVAGSAAGRQPGQVTVVFGCGGDKDAGKRPLMGEIAVRVSDRVVVTSDNPRSEDPLEIIDDIIDGVRNVQSASRPGDPSGADIRVEPDRRRAIGLAVRQAQPGDVVLIAGKGHETTQIIGDRAVPFDDRLVALAALAEAGWSR
jgi:UDP-N-acetylmuramoyl-L-alanyl-D-glutamate--2,6-diaminopimelate ligase